MKPLPDVATLEWEIYRGAAMTANRDREVWWRVLANHFLHADEESGDLGVMESWGRYSGNSTITISPGFYRSLSPIWQQLAEGVGLSPQ